LKRAIYAGRVASYQAKQPEEMQAVADALSLLANLVMAWNTMKIQSILDRWNVRRATAVPPELIGRIAPTRTEGINLCGVFSFPIEQYADSCCRHSRQRNQGLRHLVRAKSAPRNTVSSTNRTPNPISLLERVVPTTQGGESLRDGTRRRSGAVVGNELHSGLGFRRAQGLRGAAEA
jgi:hypothetical protein